MMMMVMNVSVRVVMCVGVLVTYNHAYTPIPVTRA